MCSVSLIVGKGSIDDVFESRWNIFTGIAMQYAAVYLCPKTPSDLWLSLGLSSYLTDCWMKRLHGENEVAIKRKRVRKKSPLEMIQ